MMCGAGTPCAMHGFGYWMFFQFLILATFIAIIWWLFQTKPWEQTKQESSLSIAKRRYATGEIDKEEYHDIKKELEDEPDTD